MPRANRSSANADGALPLEIRCIARQVRRLEKLLAVGFADMPQLPEAYRHNSIRFGVMISGLGLLEVPWQRLSTHRMVASCMNSL